jgi:hypothetical protein
VNTASPNKPPRASGFWWALAGFSLGSLVSVGFNLQSAWLHNPSPSLASQAAAVVWPLTLIVSVEVLSRVSWPDGKGWKFVRFSGIVAVALGSATISYGHIYDVLIAWGYERHQAIVGPLVVDGLMLISGFALVSLGRAARAATDTAQATVDESPAEPARTDSARRPVLPPHTGSEPHAVSPATPQSTPGETAPNPPAPTARPARPRMQAVARPPARRPAARTAGQSGSPASGESLNDEQVIARVRAARDTESGELPTVSWMRKELGVGQGRAARLRAEAARPDLHTVKNEEVAVG